jgi:hypothetical protein
LKYDNVGFGWDPTPALKYGVFGGEATQNEVFILKKNMMRPSKGSSLR